MLSTRAELLIPKQLLISVKQICHRSATWQESLHLINETRLSDPYKATQSEIDIVQARNYNETPISSLSLAQNEGFPIVADFKNLKKRDFEQFTQSPVKR